MRIRLDPGPYPHHCIYSDSLYFWANCSNTQYYWAPYIRTPCNIGHIVLVGTQYSDTLYYWAPCIRTPCTIGHPVLFGSLYSDTLYKWAPSVNRHPVSRNPVLVCKLFGHPVLVVKKKSSRFFFIKAVFDDNACFSFYCCISYNNNLF